MQAAFGYRSDTLRVHSPLFGRPDVRKPCLIVVNNVNIRGAALSLRTRAAYHPGVRPADRRRLRPAPEFWAPTALRDALQPGSLRPHDNFVIQAFGSCALVHLAVTIGGVRGQPACEFRMRPTGPAGSPDPGGGRQGRFRRARHSWVQPCASRVVQKRGGNRCLYRLV